MKTGFIGLGTMGMPMAKCLQRQGVEVIAWDVNKQAVQAFSEILDSFEMLVEKCDRFITMLPEGEHVELVYEEIFQAYPTKNCLFIDCSTIDVETTKLLAKRVESCGHNFVDAPVSGGREGAEKGQLSFMIGGNETGIERARPLLKLMASKITEFGKAGSGQAAKVCHNMICGITALGVCESFALADSLGLDLNRFFDLCSGAAAQSWILENRCPVPGPAPDAPASNHYAPGFAARLMAKDLGLAQRAAVAAGQSTEFGAAAAKRFQAMVESGQGDLDFSAIYNSIRR